MNRPTLQDITEMQKVLSEYLGENKVLLERIKSLPENCDERNQLNSEYVDNLFEIGNIEQEIKFTEYILFLENKLDEISNGYRN